tara:strand:+ start:1225 stop:1701 length:477 start_codon:yes stop_codon:yes gene_type:complete
VPYYESVFIARPDISPAQVESLAESMSNIVVEGGGKVVQTEYWGLKSLAYRIKKNRRGHYAMLALDAPSDAVKEYERNMRLNEDVLRLMTIRVDELSNNPSIMMKNKHSRDERSYQENNVEHIANETTQVETPEENENPDTTADEKNADDENTTGEQT